jgi:hypothetical protein
MMSDDQERQVAAEIEQSHPQWAVLWGCYSRSFWAFPCFQAQQGTIISSHNREMLLASMHNIELSVSASRQVPAAANPVGVTPAAGASWITTGTAGEFSQRAPSSYSALRYKRTAGNKM